eukprot:scaffold4371_cov125-Isochrysis_galbana.AAC.4
MRRGTFSLIVATESPSYSGHGSSRVVPYERTSSGRLRSGVHAQRLRSTHLLELLPTKHQVAILINLRRRAAKES